MKLLKISLILFVFLTGCKSSEKKVEEKTDELDSNTPTINFNVANVFQHDPTLFTEGFVFNEGKLFESTGSPDEKSKSMIGISDLKTGKFEKKVEINYQLFGEGIVFLKNKLYQLTWKTQTGYIYNAKSFKKIGEFKIKNTEGWGMTTDGINLIMSDGTGNLTYLNPENLTPIKILSVTEYGNPLVNINELEFINGFIYANIWQSDQITKIDPKNGKVVGRLNLSSLKMEANIKNPVADVLNGIAFDSTNNKIYVTGKFWNNIYEITFPH